MAVIERKKNQYLELVESLPQTKCTHARTHAPILVVVVYLLSLLSSPLLYSTLLYFQPQN